MEKDKIASDWIAYTRLFYDKADLSLVEDGAFKLSDLISKDPRLAWEIILLILDMTNDDLILSNLSAGPLEDLLTRYPEQVIFWAEKEVIENLRFKELLEGVWQNLMPDEIWERVQKISK